jgi:hypothetical protein
VYNVVESVILAMSVGLMVWLSNVVIGHGNTLASQGTQIVVNTGRLDKLESVGSPKLTAHEAMDDRRIDGIDKRIEKLENAVIALQSAPGELKAIGARLDGLQSGQTRIERLFEEHLKATK